MKMMIEVKCDNLFHWNQYFPFLDSILVHTSAFSGVYSCHLWNSIEDPTSDMR